MRLLLLLLLPALVGRFDRCRSSHVNKEIANRRFGHWMLLERSHLVNSSDLRLGIRQCGGTRHYRRAVFLNSGAIGCFACDIYLGASSACGGSEKLGHDAVRSGGGIAWLRITPIASNDTPN